MIKELGADAAKIASDPKTAVERLTALREPLTRLCATYLLQRGDVTEPPGQPNAAVL